MGLTIAVDSKPPQAPFFKVQDIAPTPSSPFSQTRCFRKISIGTGVPTSSGVVIGRATGRGMVGAALRYHGETRPYSLQQFRRYLEYSAASDDASIAYKVIFPGVAMCEPLLFRTGAATATPGNTHFGGVSRSSASTNARHAPEHALKCLQNQSVERLHRDQPNPSSPSRMNPTSLTLPSRRSFQFT